MSIDRMVDKIYNKMAECVDENLANMIKKASVDIAEKINTDEFIAEAQEIFAEEFKRMYHERVKDIAIELAGSLAFKIADPSNVRIIHTEGDAPCVDLSGYFATARLVIREEAKKGDN